MIFQNLTLREKKLLLLFLSCLLCYWVLGSPGTASAGNVPRTYTVTEAELVTLENNLARLSAINSKLQTESKTQNQQSAELLKQVQLLQSQLTALRQESEKQQALLTAANKSLEEYAIAAKKERLRIKAQRNTWIAIASCLLVALTVK